MVQANALVMLEASRKYMTRGQWELFKESSSYQQLKLMSEGRDREAMDLELFDMRGAEAEAWSIALEMAQTILTSEAAELDVKVEGKLLEMLQTTLAEKLLLNQGYLPPTYNQTVTCAECGPAPAKKAEPKNVAACVLCAGVEGL